ncbi:MAG TPA: hypothetical protein VG347_05430 [Verrucomicrobiae bacterium]|nr:hypothetical protein [Verrucomicrobiae bacterium]
MAKVTFYPLGNADCCHIKLSNDLHFVFDYADMRNPDDSEDKRIPLAKALKDNIGWPKRKEIEVLAITHGDNDHVQGVGDMFWMNHAAVYQSDDHVKFKELWIPAALLIEEGAEDCTRVIRQEARHRFLEMKSGIKVFARPEHLKDWLEERGKSLDDYRHLIVDAGRCVPGFNLEYQGVEFFVHSPFARRTEDGILDRNDNCLVMQAVVRESGRDSKFLITADSTAEIWEEIVQATRKHGNDHRLAWDLFKIPHHCSYLSMAFEKGDTKTEPTPEFAWLLEQGAQRAVMVSSSWPIPTTTEDQPPHLQTYRRYKETADKLDADLIVTMEHPNKNLPKPVVIDIGGGGVMLKHEILSGIGIITSSTSPRHG